MVEISPPFERVVCNNENELSRRRTTWYMNKNKHVMIVATAIRLLLTAAMLHCQNDGLSEFQKLTLAHQECVVVRP